MPLSIWEKESFYYHSELLIIGAGLSGLLTAIFLKEKSPNTLIRILEKGSHPIGASSKNAGFACFGSVSEILDDISAEGENKAFNRVVNRYNGLQKLKQLVPPHLFDWNENGAYEVFTETEKEIQTQCLDSLPAINSKLYSELGRNTFIKSEDNFDMNCLKESIFTAKEASINSGKLLRFLIQKARKLGVEINFNSEYISHEKYGSKYLLFSTNGEYSADRILFATNGFTPENLNLNIEPGRGQILLSSPIPQLKLKANFHLHKGYFYFRNFEGRLLLGGGRHLERQQEKTTDQNTSESIQGILEELLRSTILPKQNFKIEQRWAGTMAFGKNNEKEIINKNLGDGIFVLARFGGMGLALSSFEAEKMADKILNN